MKKGLEFSISARLTSCLRRAIEAVSEDASKPCSWETDAEWTEFSYGQAGWPKALRMIAKRTPYYEGSHRIIGEYFYTPPITSRKGIGPSILKHHLGQGGTENSIEE